MLRNKNPFLIVTPENAGINGFARINTSFAILISDRGDFCKTYFCCQGAILVLSVTKNAWPELSFAKWSLIFHFTWNGWSESSSGKMCKIGAKNPEKCVNSVFKNAEKCDILFVTIWEGR